MHVDWLSIKHVAMLYYAMYCVMYCAVSIQRTVDVRYIPQYVHGHCTLYIIGVHYTPRKVQCILYTVHCTLYTVHCTVHTMYNEYLVNQIHIPETCAYTRVVFTNIAHPPHFAGAKGCAPRLAAVRDRGVQQGCLG